MNLSDYLATARDGFNNNRPIINENNFYRINDALLTIYGDVKEALYIHILMELDLRYGTNKVADAFIGIGSPQDMYNLGSYSVRTMANTWAWYIQGIAESLTAEVDFLNTTSMGTVEHTTDVLDGKQLDTLGTTRTLTHSTKDESSLVHGETITKTLATTDTTKQTGSTTDTTTGSVAHERGAGEATTTSKTTFDNSTLSDVERNETTASGTDTDRYNTLAVKTEPNLTTELGRTGTESDAHGGTDTNTLVRSGTDTTADTGTVDKKTDNTNTKDTDITIKGNQNADYLKILSDIYNSKQIDVTTFLCEKIVEALCTGEYEFD